MPFSIALAGKGGTGKTTIAGLLIKYLVLNGKKPILAVDADSNSNFNEVLGLEVADTIGNFREEMKKGIVPNGMTKDMFISMKLQQAVVETENFDLIVMGCPEGSGCYCAANSLLVGFLEKLTANYPYIVMDNEAGMEHISRLTTRNVDILILVSDGSTRGIQAAARINDLANNLHIGMGKSFLIINQTRAEPSEKIMKMVEESKMKLAGILPADEMLYEYDMNGRPTIDLPEDNPVVAGVFKIFDKMFAECFGKFS
ncbi:Uncharacterized ATP-binding protein MJ0685 [Candidatus Magnetomoraceae bacterium gMMP-15]